MVEEGEELKRIAEDKKFLRDAREELEDLVFTYIWHLVR